MGAQLDIFAGAPTGAVVPPMIGERYISTDASLSECGRYRWTLTRCWDGLGRCAVWIMLNPSTADAAEDDATIRRCVSFSRRHAAGRLVVVNLFAWRSTDPCALRDAEDPVGPQNDDTIRRETDGRDLVIAAWGAHPLAVERGRQVLAMLGRPVLCLGTTRDGAPHHPVRLAGDTPLVPYSGGGR